MIHYKIDVVKELSRAGYTSPVLREKKLISQATLQNIREGKNINTSTLNIICLLLRKRVEDIIEVIPTDDEKIKYF